MDYFEKDPDIDRRRVAVMGHSRMGKTSAVGRRTRSALCDGDFKLLGCRRSHTRARRFGESVKDLCDKFPWWFSENYANFAGNEDALPVDQHELVALSAPRPLYVAVAEQT